VASDDILTQPISNGHAARMRFSRMRTVMQNIENQQRRAGPNPPKSKVTKPKKESRAKKEAAVKQDPASESTGRQGPLRGASPHVKQETSQIHLESQALLGSLVAAVPEANPQLRGRLLTPCSDNDFMGTPHTFHASPASDIFQADPPFDFSPTAPCPHEREACWPPSAPYQGYEPVAYDLHAYTTGFEEDRHLAQHPADTLLSPGDVMEHALGHGPIKHEEWDSCGHEI